MPRIAVIIPTLSSRRHKRYKTLQGVMEQTHKDIELVIIANEMPASKARNIGARMASEGCDYLFFLDDDVRLRSDCLEKLASALEENKKASFAYCNYRREGLIEIDHMARPFDKDWLLKKNYISTMSLVRKKDFPGFNEKLERLQDWELWIRMMKEGKHGVWVNEFLFTAIYEHGCISDENKSSWQAACNELKKFHPEVGQ